MLSVGQFARASPRKKTAAAKQASSNLGGTARPPSRRVDNGDDNDEKPHAFPEAKPKQTPALPMRQQHNPQSKHPPIQAATTSPSTKSSSNNNASIQVHQQHPTNHQSHNPQQYRNFHGVAQSPIRTDDSPFQNLIPASMPANAHNSSSAGSSKKPHISSEESTIVSVESFGTSSKGGGGGGGGGTVVSIPPTIAGIIYPQARVSGGGPVRRRVMPSSSLLTLQSIATAKTAKMTNPRQRGVFLERAESFCSFTSQRSFGASTCDASLISHASTAAEFEFHSIITASSSSKHHHHHHHAKASSNGSVSQKTKTTRHHHYHHHLSRSSSRRSVFTNNSSSNSVARPPTPPNLLRNTTQSSAACASVRSLKDPVSTALLRQISQSSAFSGTTVHSQRIVELASIPRGINSHNHKLVQPVFTHMNRSDYHNDGNNNNEDKEDEDCVSELNCSVANLSHFLSTTDDGTTVSGTAVNLSYDDSLLSCAGYPMDRPVLANPEIIYPEEEIVFEEVDSTTALHNPEQWAVSRTADTPGFVLASLSSAPEEQPKPSTIVLPESILAAAAETNTDMTNNSWRPGSGASFNSYRPN